MVRIAGSDIPVTPKGMWWVGSKKEKVRTGRSNAHRRKRFSTVTKRVIDLLDQKARAKPNDHGMQRIYNPLKFVLLRFGSVLFFCRYSSFFLHVETIICLYKT